MIPPWQKSKYSLVEKEKRFFLETLPADLPRETVQVIEDKYFPTTRLRLRKITDEAGAILALKLTQKFLNHNQPSEQRETTNLYLSEHEYTLFAVLPGYSLKKRRYSYQSLNQHYAIDVFEEHLAGLILAEIEFAEENTVVARPSFALEEVTDDSFFTGGHLAMLTQETFQAQFWAYLTK